MHPRPRTRTPWHPALLCVALLAVTLVVPLQGAGAATGDLGHRGPQYAAGAGAVTGDKPESKLWFHDGAWWGSLLGTSGGHRIARLERSSQTWTDTGVAIDPRPGSRADAVWDGSKLYVASHVVAKDSTANVAGQPSRLWRYTYVPGSRTWSLDAGFPSTVNDVSSETLTVDVDSSGRLWATWTQAASVRVTYSTDGGRTFATPAQLPGKYASGLAPDDVSAVVTYGSQLGVMWSRQPDGGMYFASRRSGDRLGSWVVVPAFRSANGADDHINLKQLQGDDTGRVFAVTKTSEDKGTSGTAPQVQVLSRGTSGGWSVSVFGTVADCHTRPVLLIDGAARRLHVFAAGPSSSSGCPFSGTAGTIYQKSSSLDPVSFPPGRGTPVIRDAASGGVNNPTTTKQSLTAASGAVVLASDATTSTYWHADLGGVPAPAAAFEVSASSGPAPLAVSFTDASTGPPGAWEWDFGDGTTSSEASPTHTFAAAGTYTVRLTVSNAAGSSSTTRTVTATGGTAVPTPSFTATPVSGRSPLLVQFRDTSAGSPTAWYWDFGDGSDGRSPAEDHIYTAPGTYTVTLWASNAAGAAQLVRRDLVTVTQGDSPPAASFTLTPTSGVAPLSVAFSDTSTGAPTEWYWDFGDGQVSREQSPRHTYTSPGRYTVVLWARNAVGAASSTREGAVVVSSA